MTPIERAISLITGVVLLVLAGGALAFVFGWSGTSIIQFLQSLRYSQFDAAVLSILLFIWGVYFILSGGRFRKSHPKALLQETELGTVRINLKAVEALVYRTAHNLREIKGVETQVDFDESGFSVNLSLVVAPDTSVPEICSRVQEQIRNYLRETIGVETRAVTVEVRGIDGSSKSRVE